MSRNITCDATDWSDDQREQVLAWVRSLDLNPGDFGASFRITRSRAGCQLHLTRFVRDENGNVRINQVGDAVESEPVVIDLAEQSWPEFLGRWSA